MDAGERALDCVCVRCKTVTMRADRTGGDQRQAVGTVVELVQHLGVAGIRVGMINALRDLPARAGSASGNRCDTRRAWIERLDGEPVGAPAPQRAEAFAFEHAV